MTSPSRMMSHSPISPHDGDLVLLVAPVHGPAEGRDAQPAVTLLTRDLLRDGYVVVSAPDTVWRFHRDRKVDWNAWVGAVAHRADLVLVICLPGWDDEESMVRPALNQADIMDIPVMVVTWNDEGELRMNTFRYGSAAAPVESLASS